ncbi:VOC family protein [Tissierella praeacuta]|uniref:VOC family protein n=1 Tax=Tissierella praeacuta TaxID=43131 RepID=UPI003342D5F4
MKAIDHLNRYVSNVDKFIDFYREVLDYGLIDKGIKENGKNYAILKSDRHELFISERDNFKIETEENFRHIGYYIENVDELLESLKLKGYVDQEKEIIVNPFSRQFYIKDPDGFEIDLIQWTDKNKFYHHLKDKNIKWVILKYHLLVNMKKS